MTESIEALAERLLVIANSTPPFAREHGEAVGTVVNLPGAIEREAAQAILTLIARNRELEGRDALRDRTAIERESRIAKLEEALSWYGEQARLCRLIHSEGDAGRKALSDDGGQRAARALSQKP